MEATALSLGKSVLDGAIGYAKSTVAEEVALKLGVQRDHAFIREELEMMRAFLRAAHDERDNDQVLMTWVKQVRDVAYDAEDCLQDCSVHLKKPSWWRLPSTLWDRHRIAKKMKELRARVEDVSQRNLRYQLVKTSGSKPEYGVEVSGAAAMSGMEEALRQQNNCKADLIRLIDSKDRDLRVIGVWGTGDVLGEKSIVRRAYDSLKRDRQFQYHAWISMVRPLSITAILQDIVMQFAVDSLKEETKKHTSAPDESQDLRSLWVAKEDELADMFKKFLNEKSYLIVVSDLSTMDEWGHIRTCFPTNKKGSRLLVCTEHVKVANLCVEPSTLLREHKQLFPDKALYAFYDKGSQDITCSVDPGSSSTIDIMDDSNSGNGKYLVRMETNLTAFKEYNLIGRQNEKSQILKLISNEVSQDFKVISVWGMGGLGKTTLVKDVYQNQELNAKFDKRACVTVKRPFNAIEVLNSLAEQLSGKKEWKDDILDGKKYLIVLDDLSTTKEWDDIQSHFPRMVKESRIIVTTRLNTIARHCSSMMKHIVDLKVLEEKEAHDLFTEKVFGKITNLEEECPELHEEAKLIMKKCNGLPLAIVTIGGFLAKQAKSPMEWKKLNSHIGAELEMNEGLRKIKNILNKSYDGLPYHLKPCFLYLSIFPEDDNIKRSRLVHRWIAEGYSTEVLGKPLIETAEGHFMELIDRSMILPNKTCFSQKVIDSCQVHDVMREISISMATEENFVFRLEEGCSSNTNGTVRHLSISANWKGDEADFESMVDVSRVRSLTVFGRWRPFFISDKMRFLRVLDLQNTWGLCNHHLEHIGKLVHLRYLSLRGCDDINHLPDSVGNMRQLQTLDIRGTYIGVLPKTIVKLKQLQYLYLGRSRTASSCWGRVLKVCVAFYSRLTLLWNRTRRERCFAMRNLARPSLYTSLPRGVGNLKALRTLGDVDIGSGKAIIKEIKKLTKLRKLKVTGMNEKDCHEFYSALNALSCLESLSVFLGDLSDIFSPPKNLRTLKVVHGLGKSKMPVWIVYFRNLVKLKLEMTNLTDSDGTMEQLGNLPNLAILILGPWTFELQVLCLNFVPGAFPSLEALELCGAQTWAGRNETKSVEFKQGAAPKLEMLRFIYFETVVTNDGLFSGLASLLSLKKFQLSATSLEGKEAFVEHVRAQLAQNPNQPSLVITGW